MDGIEDIVVVVVTLRDNSLTLKHAAGSSYTHAINVTFIKHLVPEL